MVSGAVALVVIGTIVFGGNGTGEGETLAVIRRDIIEEVRVSGTVEARIVSDVGFETSGIVREVAVAVNDQVYRGQTLVSLSLGTLVAELQSAQAQVAIKRANVANTTINLDAIKEKQDTLVQNALSELLSDDLIAEPQSPSYTQTPPVVSGRYTKGIEGTYKINLKSALQNGETDMYVFGLEKPEPIRVRDTGATAIGTHGLSILFSGDPSSYHNTIWYITIPNKNGDSYATNYSAYQDALRERDRALDEAQTELRAQESGVSIAEAELAQAEAEVARIQALISQRILSAPFDGVVTSVDVDPGESVGSNTKVVSMISNDGFGIEIDLPEIDSIKVKNGNLASITLDALGAEEVLPARVVSVNRTETLVDDIAVYEARLAFENQDPRIASGMTADVVIITNRRDDVLALPIRAFRFREDGTAYVTVLEGDEERGITVGMGLRGSDGFVEVTAGLVEGQSVLIPE